MRRQPPAIARIREVGGTETALQGCLFNRLVALKILYDRFRRRHRVRLSWFEARQFKTIEELKAHRLPPGKEKDTALTFARISRKRSSKFEQRDALEDNAH
jgi:hypothetical protein